MEKPIIIAVVGLTGSGKTDVNDQFVKHGFVPHKYSSAIYEELDRRGLEYNETNERAVREGLRRDFGMGVAADRIMPRVEQAVAQGKNVVIESLYSWSEYKKTKDRFGEQFKVLAIYAPPEIRYERLVKRTIRAIDPKVARARDHAEIENVEKAGPIAMADWTIINNGNRKDFLAQVDTLIKKLLA